MIFSSEMELWQEVVRKGVVDALRPANTQDPQERYYRRDARHWIRNKTKDFQVCCDLAGWDADFISEAYNNGRIDFEKLETLGLGRRRRALTK